jgi:hypothetical protein
LWKVMSPPDLVYQQVENNGSVGRDGGGVCHTVTAVVGCIRRGRRAFKTGHEILVALSINGV